MMSSFAAEAKTVVKYTSDNSAKATAYFSGKTLLGIHLYDNKCDGDGVRARVIYKTAEDEGDDMRQDIDNYQGCHKDLWDDTNYENVEWVKICRLKGPLHDMEYCVNIYP